MKLEELARAYREFFKGALGQDLLTRLDTLHAHQLQEATKTDKETAWGMLSRAAGVELVRAEIKRVQALDRKGAGRS